jgi:hypothetical protein
MFKVFNKYIRFKVASLVLGLLSFNREFLNTAVKDCSNFLKKEGLRHYRIGDLSQAIVIWSNILAFEPDNTEMKKAIKKASIQLKNLKKEK